MKSPFDAHLHLCAGQLGLFKRISQFKLRNYPETIETLISRFIKPARRVSDLNRDTLIRLIEDFDRTGQTLAKAVTPDLPCKTQKDGIRKELLANGLWCIDKNDDNIGSILT
jgi:hypothetical protein